MSTTTRDKAKFRVWDIAQAAMIYFSFENIYEAKYFERPTEHCVWGEAKSKYANNPHMYPLPKSTKITRTDNPVMRCTEIVDKNGVMVFEGDLVQYSWLRAEHDVEQTTGEVFFEEGVFLLGRTDQFATNDCNFLKKTLEVIGNIHENPTLKR